MLRQDLVLCMFAIGTVLLGTRNRRPWNQPPDLRSLEGDPGGTCDMERMCEHRSRLICVFRARRANAELVESTMRAPDSTRIPGTENCQIPKTRGSPDEARNPSLMTHRPESALHAYCSAKCYEPTSPHARPGLSFGGSGTSAAFRSQGRAGVAQVPQRERPAAM